jgi:probable HAF family extracellular repeat protein
MLIQTQSVCGESSILRIDQRMFISAPRLYKRKRGEMTTFRQLRNFWAPVTTVVLACLSNATAQANYKIIDLGINKSSDNFSMVMGLNSQGWAENMDGFVNPPETSTSTTIARGRAVISIYGFNIDLGTLGKSDGNSWNNYGGINDRGEAVGMSETADPDPNGEDICAFGTHLTCVPFLWRDGHMSALPTLGGNNGEAGAINNRGEVVGFAEDGAVDSTCPAGKTNNRIQLPVLWERGEAHALPTVGGDVDGFALAINDRGQAVGDTGSCAGATHAVLWEDGTPSPLPSLGSWAVAQCLNERGQIAGYAGNPGAAFSAVLWRNGADGAVTNLGILPGDSASFATGINSKGQVVGSDFDPHGNWSNGFIWQDGVMTNLNKLISADSNLYIIAASNINDRGQISGMARVQAGPHAGNLHAFLLIPVQGRIGTSMADFAGTHPHAILHANACHDSLQRLRLGGSER